MYRRQDGITVLGFLILAAFIGLFILAGVKLAPVYLESMDVKAALAQTKTELDGNRPTISEIRKAVQRRFDVDSVRRLTSKDVKITRGGEGFIVDASYEGRVDYIGNLALVLTFDNKVEIVN
ncbi:MAG: DUF4845 domain-containing protein [Gammaproteobacteria bacterium]